MKRVRVAFTEIVDRVTIVEVPDGIHAGDVNKYVEDYIYGYVDDSYDWAVSDIVQDETVIHHVLIEGQKL
jgi:hypothetical protein